MRIVENYYSNWRKTLVIQERSKMRYSSPAWYTVCTLESSEEALDYIDLHKNPEGGFAVLLEVLKDYAKRN